MAVSSGNTRTWGQTASAFARVLLDAGKTVTKGAIPKLGNACEEAIKSLDWQWPRGRGNMSYASGFLGGDAMHPWYSGTLHDSVAAGVADGTRLLTARYMEPNANFDQEYKGQKIVGAELAQTSLRNAVKFASGGFGTGVGGLRAILVVGVPYANTVNSSPTIGWRGRTPNTHIGYVQDLGKYFAGEVEGAVKDLGKTQIKMK